MYHFIAVDFSKHWTRTCLQRDTGSTGTPGTIWIVSPVTKASWKDLSDKFGKGKALLLFLLQTKRRKRISLLRTGVV